ncbi:MAG: DUF4129 domain-containing protein [Propionibacteriaceae bacterium]|nr:DUF4129 domain-containing protein [Propionibacteriaceae bacterium]
MSPPLEPSADEARRELARELIKPEYLDPGSWLVRLRDRILEWLAGVDAAGFNLSGAEIAVIALVGAAAVGLVVARVAGPLRRERRAAGGGFLAGEERSAAELRADAERLAAAGDWTAATLQRFRALVRGLSERVIVREVPGLTAREAALQAEARLPAFAAGLAEAADLFDALAYGGRDGTRAGYDALVTLDQSVAAARPERLGGDPASPDALGSRVARAGQAVEAAHG